MFPRSILEQSALAAAVVLSGIPATIAHSWVEQLNRIAPNGTMIAPEGYQRGYIGRGDPGFRGDVSDDLWQIPPNDRAEGPVIYPTDLLCAPQQKIGTYNNPKYPKLVTAPGDWVAMRHQENGHVTLPATQENKPRNRGTIYIYGTEKPGSNDTLMSIHNVWNADGTGGDGRGRLLATRNYDDGQCYQKNGGDISVSRTKQFNKAAANPMGEDLWCQSDVQLPSDLTVGTDYTLYWVWDWPTLSKANAMVGDKGVEVARPETYTSCMDVEIVDPCADELGDVKSPACSSGTGVGAKSKAKFSHTFAKGQSWENAAVPQELSGNFAVGVDGATPDSSSNTGMSAPPNLAGSGGNSGNSGSGSSSGNGNGHAGTTGSASAGHPAPTGRPAPSGNAGAAPSTLSTVTTPATSATSAAGASGATVTVTEGATTVTVTASATVDPVAGVVGEDSNGGLTVPTPGVAPAVEPFTRRRRSRIERNLS
ncbi:hypothetical protein DHEL01_v201139 [Diaporthe helianthi]|uniref:DUF7492 domain-containing protein n=1 Tax=Diaporthe helianthi TaxID=158607 RepID=A0A2P5IDC6_DIAHE|nr:hypothetical protein DHEL01_v201139 [Diaporthe helianthi]